MSASGDLDVRVPIGALFTALGLLLAVYGFLHPTPSAAAFTKGGQVNMWWGIVMLVFGLVMLFLGRPRRTQAPE